MKKIILALLIIGLLVSGSGYASTLTTSEDYIPSEILIQDNIRITSEECVITDDVNEIKSLIKECKKRKEAAKRMEKAGYDLGYAKDHPIVQAAKVEWTNANDDLKFYQESLQKLEWQAKEEEYPNAAFIWSYLKDKGYNDYVIAGILGNIMAEVGGQTLKIRAAAEGHGYYGMCQWSVVYFPGVVGKDLQGQCKFLTNNIKKAFNTWGFLYKDNFEYADFCELQDERAAALAFAQCYERCSNASYTQRQKNAEKAYEYFVGE